MRIIYQYVILMMFFTATKLSRDADEKTERDGERDRRERGRERERMRLSRDTGKGGRERKETYECQRDKWERREDEKWQRGSLRECRYIMQDTFSWFSVHFIKFKFWASLYFFMLLLFLVSYQARLLCPWNVYSQSRPCCYVHVMFSPRPDPRCYVRVVFISYQALLLCPCYV